MGLRIPARHIAVLIAALGILVQFASGPVAAAAPTVAPVAAHTPVRVGGAGSTLPFGDADCDGDVDSVDSLKQLRHVAALSVNQTDPCTDIGSFVGVQVAAAAANRWGDVDCDGDVDAVDGLKDLRHVAALPVEQNAKCPSIGAAVLVSEFVPDVLSSGDGTLQGTYAFDFDTGQQIVVDNDVFWDQITEIQRELDPENGALLANLGVVDFDALDFAALEAQTYSASPINGDDNDTNLLVTGDVFAVMTSQGNLAKVLVVLYDYTLQLQWVTYDVP